MNEYEQNEALARKGDMRAFGQLIRAWDGDLRGVAWAVSRSRAHIDDIMQTTYEKAVRSIPSFRGDASLKTWLHSICYRTALDHMRFEGRRRHEPDAMLGALPSHRSTSGSALANTELALVLGQLDHESRTALMLTAGLGYSFDEAAEILGLPRGTVAAKVRRAKQAVAEQNNEDREGDQ